MTLPTIIGTVLVGFVPCASGILVAIQVRRDCKGREALAGWKEIEMKDTDDDC